MPKAEALLITLWNYLPWYVVPTSEHIPIAWFFLQSLRARTEQSLVRNQQEDVDSARYAIKQVLSFTLTDQVGPNQANNFSTPN